VVAGWPLLKLYRTSTPVTRPPKALLMARTRRRKRHTQQADAAAAPGGAGGAVPRSFVLKRGRLAALVDELADDVRKVRHAGLARAETALSAALRTLAR